MGNKYFMDMYIEYSNVLMMAILNSGTSFLRRVHTYIFQI